MKSQRRRGFGPQNNYMDKLGGGPKNTPKPTPRRAGMGMGSYLDNLSSSSSSSSTNANAAEQEIINKSSEKQPKDEKLQQEKKPQRKKSTAPAAGMGSYLDNLSSSSSSSAASEPPQPKKKASFEMPRRNPFVEEVRSFFLLRFSLFLHWLGTAPYHRLKNATNSLLFLFWVEHNRV
jgi:hypothetical protein